MKVIAELGINPPSDPKEDLGPWKRYARLAKEAGADIIKVQYYDVDKVIGKEWFDDWSRDYLKIRTSAPEDYWEELAKNTYEFTKSKEHNLITIQELYNYVQELYGEEPCGDGPKHFMVSVFEPYNAKMLYGAFGDVILYKVGSRGYMDTELAAAMRHVKDLFVSVPAGRMRNEHGEDEIASLWEASTSHEDLPGRLASRGNNWPFPLYFMCIPEYPTSLERAIEALLAERGLAISHRNMTRHANWSGYSCHSSSLLPCLAVHRWRRWDYVEHHVLEERDAEDQRYNVDASSSWTFEELGKFIAEMNGEVCA